MKYIIGAKSLAEALGISLTTARLLTKKPDFPVIRQEGIKILSFDMDACKEWWNKNHLDIYRQEIQKEGFMIVTDFAKHLGVSRSYVVFWIDQKGLKSQKTKRGRIINLEDARRFFLSQNDKRVQAYAEKLPTKEK